MFSRRHQQHPNPPALAWPASPRTSGVRGAIRSWAVALGSVAAIGLLAGPAAATTASWQVIQGPVLPSGELLAVGGLGPADVWAVGDHFTTAQGYKTLTEHWDGTTWSVSPSPVPGPGESELTGITALPDGTFWAVGARQQPNGTFTPLTLRHAPG